jgi:hypothetical protein
LLARIPTVLPTAFLVLLSTGCSLGMGSGTGGGGSGLWGSGRCAPTLAGCSGYEDGFAIRLPEDVGRLIIVELRSATAGIGIRLDMEYIDNVADAGEPYVYPLEIYTPDGVESVEFSNLAVGHEIVVSGWMPETLNVSISGDRVRAGVRRPRVPAPIPAR